MTNYQRAHAAVHRAVRDGLLSRPTERACVDCSGEATLYHHESYEPDQWLNVVPLCRPCHHARHRIIRVLFMDETSDMITGAAKKAGMSVNEWLTRAAEKALGRIKP